MRPIQQYLERTKSYLLNSVCKNWIPSVEISVLQPVGTENLRKSAWKAKQGLKKAVTASREEWNCSQAVKLKSTHALSCQFEVHAWRCIRHYHLTFVIPWLVLTFLKSTYLSNFWYRIHELANLFYRINATQLPRLVSYSPRAAFFKSADSVQLVSLLFCSATFEICTRILYHYCL